MRIEKLKSKLFASKFLSIRNLLVALILIPMVFAASFIAFSFYKINQIRTSQSEFSSVISATQSTSMITSELLIRQKNIINISNIENLNKFENTDLIKDSYKNNSNTINSYFMSHNLSEGDEIIIKLNNLFDTAFKQDSSLLEKKKNAVILQNKVIDSNKLLSEEIEKYNIIAAGIAGKLTLLQKKDLRNALKAIKNLGKTIEAETDYLKIYPLLEEIKDKINSKTINASDASNKINIALSKIAQLAVVISFEDNIDNLISTKDNKLKQLFSLSENTLQKLKTSLVGTDQEASVKILLDNYDNIKNMSVNNEDSLYNLRVDTLTANKELQLVILDIKDNTKAMFSILSELSSYNSKIQEENKAKIDKIIFNTKVFLIFSGMSLLAILLPLGLISFITITNGIKTTSVLINQVTNHDLSSKANKIPSNEMGTIIKLIEKMTSSLVEIIQQIQTTSIALDKNAAEINNSTSNITEKMQQQLSETDKIQSNINNISSSSSKVSTCSLNANQKVESSMEAVNSGNNIVIETRKSITTLLEKIDDSEHVINEVKDNSNHITSALDMINSISEQTNLLALNAAIEAARAGDAGRGFSVVADEVRTLATKSRNSSDEIRTIIDNLQSNAAKSVKSMAECKLVSNDCLEQANNSHEALQVISNAVNSIKEMTDEIEKLSSNQSELSTNVCTGLHSLKEISDEINKDVTNNSSSCGELARISKELTSRSDIFKLPN